MSDAAAEFEAFGRRFACSTAGESEVMGAAMRLYAEVVRLRSQLVLVMEEKAMQNAYIGMLEAENMRLKVRLGEAGNA